MHMTTAVLSSQLQEDMLKLRQPFHQFCKLENQEI